MEKQHLWVVLLCLPVWHLWSCPKLRNICQHNICWWILLWIFRADFGQHKGITLTIQQMLGGNMLREAIMSSSKELIAFWCLSINRSYVLMGNVRDSSKSCPKRVSCQNLQGEKCQQRTLEQDPGIGRPVSPQVSSAFMTGVLRRHARRAEQ